MKTIKNLLQDLWYFSIMLCAATAMFLGMAWATDGTLSTTCTIITMVCLANVISGVVYAEAYLNGK